MVSALVGKGGMGEVYTLNGAPVRYQLYVPSDYVPTRAWPLIVSLHGNGRQGGDGMFQTGTDFAASIRAHRAPFPALVVFSTGAARHALVR